MSVRPALDETSFKAVFEAALDAVAICDDERRYIYVNVAACRLLEVPREELLGASIEQFAAPTAERVQRTWSEFVEDGEQCGLFEVRTRTNRNKLIEYRARAHFMPGLHLSIMREALDPQSGQFRILRGDADEQSGRSAGLQVLTNRERQVLQFIAQGQSTPEIALHLRISTRTVETHRKNLTQKLGVRSIAGLTKLALRSGLIRFGDGV